MKIYYRPDFVKSYKKLSLDVKEKAELKEGLFRKNPFNPQLRTHKLHGKLKNLWSFSVDNKVRVLFRFEREDIIFLDIGDHDLYK